MPFYTITLCFIILNVIFTLLSLKAKKKVPVFLMLTTFAGGVISVLTMNIPVPEIYATNGTAKTGNEIYITAEWPLTIKYTLVPNEEPVNDYTGRIPVSSSMMVSAKASFFGIKESALVSRDVIIGDSLDIIESVIPGSSVKEIKGMIRRGRIFPGDCIKKEDIRVEGVTLSGEHVVIENFEFDPVMVHEGSNQISVSYKNLSDSIQLFATEPALMEIDCSYVGNEIHVNDSMKNEDFSVRGLYEDGKWREEADFTIEPAVFEEAGEQSVIVNIGEISNTVPVKVLPKEYLFSVVNELHSPSGAYDPKVTMYRWKEGENYTVDGKTFSDGLIIEFDNWMSGLMGNGNDFATNVESNLYIAVNQNVHDKISPDDRYLNGQLVVERGTNGSVTTATVSILVDGVEVYNSGEITSVSTNIEKFHISVDGAESVVFRTNAHSAGYPFLLALIVEPLSH